MEYRDRQKRVNCQLVARFKQSGLISSKEHFNESMIKHCNMIRLAADEENKAGRQKYVCTDTNLESFQAHLNNNLKAISANGTVD